MSYAVETDTDIKCAYMNDLDNFMCSNLDLYTTVYTFMAYGQLQDKNGAIIRSIALTMNSTPNVALGSCK